ncbi:class III extradiol dioxygenase subunit B-like domain-containing protein [Micromonospora sp. R77]|uniref:class III extradiol dioxygenase subunit B-like domain-containing protein n=1 Tax=Micromonospora sp. R77 TaxID=2925836 RepID=UPI001F601D2A|nr:class III extradiol dioxygenase subunit B-like domain-containing protein [Micromonospora sp. R77]MCI4064897.1 class III extradiol dioxygenase subunit B-like domain-containing protein [Micromonospora sp. R77]
MTGSARGRTGGCGYGERVPLVAAAVCPHPPLIVPELAGAAAPELDELRAAADAAVAGLYATGARTVVVIGGGDRTADLSRPFRGSFAPWGLPLTVELGASPGQDPRDEHPPERVPGVDRPPAGTDELPLSLLVGAWLLRRTPPGRPTTWRMATVAADAPTLDCAARGARMGSAQQPWALLVMGDGSACLGSKSPGYDDPRAEAYDEGVARALAGADAEALLGLDPVESAELKVAGRAAWQVLAGAVRAAGGDWRGELSHHSAPYGVAYFVANWARA